MRGRCISGNNNTLNWDVVLSMAVGASWEETPSEGACADECGPQGERDVVAGNRKRRRSYSGLAGAGRQAGRQAGCRVELQRRAWPE
jgi:hypothetical protein